jgi:hypothetical protein
MFETSEEELQESISVNPQNLLAPSAETSENALATEIADLWEAHESHKYRAKEEAQTLRILRAELGERLSGMKQLLARPGRGGQWSAWLKEQRILRATADRLVQKHEHSLIPDNNCLNDAISEPTEAEIQKLLHSVLPKLRPVLRTKDSVDRFIGLLRLAVAKSAVICEPSTAS